MLKGYVTLDFGTSFFKDKPVTRAALGKAACILILGLVEYLADLYGVYSIRH